MGGRIQSGTAFMLIAVALFIDAIQAILNFLLIGIVINPFIDVIMWMVFGLWFGHVGIKRQASLGMAAVAEFIPIVNSLPIWTGYMIFLIASSKWKSAVQGGDPGAL